jgi:nickel-dependent lactate racemase
VQTFWPRTPPPLSDRELEAALESPVGQQPLRELARGKQRPVIIVDDLTRPTPAYRVLPIVLRHLNAAGILASQVTVVMGGGTHRAATPQQMLLKIGAAAQDCRLRVHDQRHGLVRVGRTSFGTPVIVNAEVAASDLLIAIGGVYPQHSVGFGGGSKLLLGVLGRRSIVGLHYGHGSVAGSYDTDNDFRRDLDEMAGLVGLRTIVTLHVDAGCDVVRIVSGDQRAYYRDAVEFSRAAYSAPLPKDADVVIANAYPMDVSLTFTRSKGLAPLAHAEPRASRVLIAACREGLGHHGLFPFLNGPRFEKPIHILRRMSVVRPSQVPAKIVRRAARVTRRLSSRGRNRDQDITRNLTSTGNGAGPPEREILLYPPGVRPGLLPDTIPGMTVCESWRAVVATIKQQQGDNRPLRVAVYPSSPLHCLELGGADVHDHLAAGPKQIRVSPPASRQ